MQRITRSQARGGLNQQENDGVQQENMGKQKENGTKSKVSKKKVEAAEKPVDKQKNDAEMHKSEELPVKKTTKAKATKKKAENVVESDQNGEDSPSHHSPPKKAKGKAAKDVKVKAEPTPDMTAPKSDDDDNYMKSPSPPPSKKASAPKKVKGTGKAPKSGPKNLKKSDSTENSESEAAAKEPTPPKKTSASKNVKANGKATKSNGRNLQPADSTEGSDEEQVKNSSPPKNEGKQLMNQTKTDYSQIDFNSNKNFNLKIASWNVAGLRSLARKNDDYIEVENPDVICLNEVKCGSEKEIPVEFCPEEYHAYWNLAKGSSGIGLLSKTEPLSVVNDIPGTEFADEKRMITAEFKNFFLVSVYVVNAGRGLKTLDKRLDFNEVFDNYIKNLDKRKPVIIAGDMNVSHQEIDLANPKANKKNAGFTPEERDGFTKLLSYGFVDTFRSLYPEQTGAYTFWTYMGNSRTRNVGWRLDYFLVSKRLQSNVKDSIIRSQVMGSDHCPIVLLLNI